MLTRLRGRRRKRARNRKATPARKPKSSRSVTDKLKTARGRPKRRPHACFSHCRFLFLLLGLLVSRLRGFVGLPGMLMGRRRVFFSCLVVALSVMFCCGAMRLGGIFVMLSCFLMCVFWHDDLLFGQQMVSIAFGEPSELSLARYWCLLNLSYRVNGVTAATNVLMVVNCCKVCGWTLTICSTISLLVRQLIF